MVTLNSLKQALLEHITEEELSQKQPLSDEEYNKGFRILLEGPGRLTYEQFIVPELTRLLDPVFTSRTHVSILEIGPGPESILVSRSAQKVTFCSVVNWRSAAKAIERRFPGGLTVGNDVRAFFGALAFEAT